MFIKLRILLILFKFKRVQISKGSFVCSILLSLVIFFLPQAIFAADMVVDNTDAAKMPQLIQTDKGIPQINIVNPENGLSHNRFEKYNVDEKGVVINNSLYSGAVEGIGHVEANPKISEPAKTVLFEVTGASRSELKGINAIVGDRAKFILANPNGITCNGCGFINGHEVELRTDKLISVVNGQANWEKNLNSDIYIGNGGAIIRDGSLTLSAGNIKVEGAITAKEILKLEAHYTQSTADKKEGNKADEEAADTPKKKQEAIYAIDVSTVSPITAGKIYLVATGEGAGVKIAASKLLITEDEEQPQGAIKKDKGEVSIEAKEHVEIQGSLISSPDKLKIQGKDIFLVDSSLNGDKEVNFISQDLLNTDSSYIKSNGNLTINAVRLNENEAQYDIHGDVHVKSSYVLSRLSNLMSKGAVELYLDSLKSKLSRISSDKKVNINAKEQIELNGSNIFSKEDVNIDAKRFELKGEMQVSDVGKPYHLGGVSGKNIAITAEHLINDEGIIKAGNGIDLVGKQIINKGGRASTGKDEHEDGYKFWQGNIISRETLRIKSSEMLDNTGLIESLVVNIEGNYLKNEGLINGSKDLVYSLIKGVPSTSSMFGSIENKGTMSAGEQLKVRLESEYLLDKDLKIENDGYFIGKDTEISSDVLENRGKIFSSNNMSLKGEKTGLFNKEGVIEVGNILKIEGRVFNNQGNRSELNSGYLDLRVKDFKNEGLVSYYAVCDKCKFEMDLFTNYGRYLTETEFRPNGLKRDVLLDGEFKAGVFNLITEGNIELVNTGKVIGLDGIRLTGRQITLLGELQSSLIQLDSKSSTVNKGRVIAEKQFAIFGEGFENYGDIEIGTKGVIANQEQEKRDEAKESKIKVEQDVTIFEAKVKSFFRNYGKIAVGNGVSEKEKWSLVDIDGTEEADIENHGSFSTNKLVIRGKSVVLGGVIDLLGDSGEIYVKSKGNTVFGFLPQENVEMVKRESRWNISAHTYVFNAEKFILTESIVLKDKGILDERKGVFITAKEIECGSNSVLDINGRVLLKTESHRSSKEKSDAAGSQIITGKIIGYPALQIETDGIHRITNKLELSDLIYPNKLDAVYFEGNLAQVEIQNQAKNRNSLLTQPLKIYTKLLQLSSAGLLDSYRPLQLFADKIDMQEGGQIKSQGNITALSKDMIGSGAFNSGGGVSLIAREGWIGDIAINGHPNSYKIQAKETIALGTPYTAIYGPLKTENGDIEVRAQTGLLAGDVNSGGNFIEVLTKSPQQDPKLDLEEYSDVRLPAYLEIVNKATSGFSIKAKKSVLIDAKEKLLHPTVSNVEAGEVLELNCKGLVLGADDKLKSGGKLKLNIKQNARGKGNLESGDTIFVSSEGNVQFGSVRSYGNIYLKAKDTLSISEIDTDKKGDVELYGKKIEDIKNINRVQDLFLYGQEIGSIGLSNARNVRVAGEVPEQKRNTEEPATDFYLNTPMEIDGNFVFAGRNFVNNGNLKAQNITLNLSEGFFNNEKGEITANENWLSVSKGFVNHHNMYIGDSFQIKGDYFVADNGGKISVGSGPMVIYLSGKYDRAFSLESDSILEKRSGSSSMALATTEGGMYFGYKQESSEQEGRRLIDLELGIQSNVPVRTNSEFPQFTYVGSQLLNRGSGIYLQSAKDVIFEGSNVLSNGDFHVETKGKYEERPMIWRYSRNAWTEVTSQHSGSNRKNWEGIRDRESAQHSVSLLPRFIIKGNKVIEADKDVLFSGSNNLIWENLFVRSGGSIVAESVGVLYNNNADVAHPKSLPEFSGDSSGSELAEFKGAQVSNEARISYIGGNFLVGKDITFIAKEDVKHLGTTVISYGGHTKLIAEKGDIIAAAKLGMYLREINSNEILYKPEIRSAIFASINGTLMALNGTVLNSGSVISAKEFLEIIAKNIELKAASETVTQFRVEEESNLLSSETRKTWETQTESSLATLAAKHINLTATDRYYSEGADIQSQPSGTIKIIAPEVTIAAHKEKHEAIVEIDRSGLSIPGIVGAIVQPKPNLKDSIISHTPILNAVRDLWHTKSPTDLLPTVQFGMEVLRILTAQSGTEAIMDQAGLTSIGGIPVPNGLGFYNHLEKTTQMAEMSRPGIVKGPDILIQGKNIAIIGSQIIGDQIKIDSEDKLEVKPAVLRMEVYTDIKDDLFSFSFSGKEGGGVSSVGFTFGGGEGHREGSGHNLAYSYIGGGNELKTTVNINVKNGVVVASPIEANTVNIKAGNLLVETLQEVWTERSSYTGWSAGLTFVAGSPYPIPSGSYNRNLGSRDKKWAEIPAWIKGNDVYVDLEGECKLIGGGILGRNVTLNAKSLNWENVYSQDKSRETSFGLSLGASMNGIGKIGSGAVTADRSFSNIAVRAGSIVKGFASYFQSGSDQERVTRATISKDANINLKDQDKEKALKDLNRDESEVVKTSEKDEYTYSIGLPIIDVKEVKEKLENSWVLHQVDLQQQSEDKNLPESEKKLLETKKEVVDFVKDEAIKEGLAPEDVQDVIEDLTEEKVITENLEKLNEYHEGKEFSVNELEEVLSGKIPTKDKDGQIKFTESIPIKNTREVPSAPATKVTTTPQDITINTNDLETKKEALKAKWRKFAAEVGDLGISLVPVYGPPTGAAFSQVVKGERDDAKSLEGLAWGAADLTIVGMIKKVKTGGKLASMVPKGVKLFEETKDLMKVKVVKIEEHHFLTNKHKTFFTKEFGDIVKKYGLKLDEQWNKEFMEHCGRHATKYHEWALEQVDKIAKQAKGNTEKFLELFEKNIAAKVKAKPEMLKKEYWPKSNQGGPK
jgi:filamentous hemagglutinin family protein